MGKGVSLTEGWSGHHLQAETLPSSPSCILWVTRGDPLSCQEGGEAPSGLRSGPGSAFQRMLLGVALGNPPRCQFLPR